MRPSLVPRIRGTARYRRRSAQAGGGPGDHGLRCGRGPRDYRVYLPGTLRGPHHGEELQERVRWRRGAQPRAEEEGPSAIGARYVGESADDTKTVLFLEKDTAVRRGQFVKEIYDNGASGTVVATSKDGTVWDTTSWMSRPASGTCVSRPMADAFVSVNLGALASGCPSASGTMLPL